MKIQVNKGSQKVIPVKSIVQILGVSYSQQFLKHQKFSLKRILDEM